MNGEENDLQTKNIFKPKYFQVNNQNLQPETVIKDIEEKMKPVLQRMEQVIDVIKDYFAKYMIQSVFHYFRYFVVG